MSEPVSHPPTIPLVRVTRAAQVESVHYGRYLVMREGEVIESGGGIDGIAFYRSCSKPLQALVGVTSGAARRFGLDEACLALACGSHNGEPAQIEVARSMLEAIGLDDTALQCGGHWSLAEGVARQQARRLDNRPPPIWNNCSGKHALMLAAAKAMDAPTDTYLSVGHPVQVEIRNHIALLSGLEPHEVIVSFDGCSAPTFAMPMRAMAHSFWRFLSPDGLPDDLADACGQLAEAMESHPEMVAGDERFDTRLMQAAEGRVLAKAGAEGMHVSMVPERDLVILVAVEDGSDRGYRHLVLDLLERYEGLDAEAAAAVRKLEGGKENRNHAGQLVGRLLTACDPE